MVPRKRVDIIFATLMICSVGERVIKAASPEGSRKRASLVEKLVGHGRLKKIFSPDHPTLLFSVVDDREIVGRACKFPQHEYFFIGLRAMYIFPVFDVYSIYLDADYATRKFSETRVGLFRDQRFH